MHRRSSVDAFALYVLCCLLMEFKRICIGNGCCRVSTSMSAFSNQGQHRLIEGRQSPSCWHPMHRSNRTCKLILSPYKKNNPFTLCRNVNDFPLNSTSASKFCHSRSTDRVVPCRNTAWDPFVSSYVLIVMNALDFWRVCSQDSPFRSIPDLTESALAPNLVCALVLRLH